MAELGIKKDIMEINKKFETPNLSFCVNLQPNTLSLSPSTPPTLFLCVVRYLFQNNY